MRNTYRSISVWQNTWKLYFYQWIGFYQGVINLPCGLDGRDWNKGPCFANVKARISSVHLLYPLVYHPYRSAKEHPTLYIQCFLGCRVRTWLVTGVHGLSFFSPHTHLGTWSGVCVRACCAFTKQQ